MIAILTRDEERPRGVTARQYRARWFALAKKMDIGYAYDGSRDDFIGIRHCDYCYNKYGIVL